MSDGKRTPQNVPRTPSEGPHALPVLSEAFKEYMRNPPPESAAARATEFGIDLSITYANMYGKSLVQRLRTAGLKRPLKRRASPSPGDERLE